MIKTMLCLAVLCTSASAQTEQRTLTLDVNKLGIEISPTLSGIFFEDINQSLDGGICAQMIQNNSFQAYNVPDGPANEFSQSDTVFFGWTVVQTDGAVGEAHAVSNRPLVTPLERKYDYDPNDKYDDEQRYVQYCVKFDIQKAGEGFGIAANGYGITPSTRERGAIYSNNTQRPSLAVESGVKYDVGLYLQGDNYKGIYLHHHRYEDGESLPEVRQCGSHRQERHHQHHRWQTV